MILNDLASLGYYWISNPLAPGLIMPTLLRNGILEIKGHCYGMSATSILYFEEKLSIPGNYPNTYSIPELKSYEMVRKYQRNQGLLVFKDPSPNNLLELVKATGYIAQNSPPQILLRGTASHAVVAYKTISSSTTRWMFIYDNEIPSGPNIITIPETGTFNYYGFDRFFINTQLDLMLDDKLAKLVIDAYRIFNYENNLTNVFIGSPIETLLTESKGNRLGYLNGILIDEMVDGYIWQISGETFFSIPSI